MIEVAKKKWPDEVKVVAGEHPVFVPPAAKLPPWKKRTACGRAWACQCGACRIVRGEGAPGME